MLGVVKKCVCSSLKMHWVFRTKTESQKARYAIETVKLLYFISHPFNKWIQYRSQHLHLGKEISFGQWSDFRALHLNVLLNTEYLNIRERDLRFVKPDFNQKTWHAYTTHLYNHTLTLFMRTGMSLLAYCLKWGRGGWQLAHQLLYNYTIETRTSFL